MVAGSSKRAAAWTHQSETAASTEQPRLRDAKPVLQLLRLVLHRQLLPLSSRALASQSRLYTHATANSRQHRSIGQCHRATSESAAWACAAPASAGPAGPASASAACAACAISEWPHGPCGAAGVRAWRPPARHARGPEVPGAQLFCLGVHT